MNPIHHDTARLESPVKQLQQVILCGGGLDTAATLTYLSQHLRTTTNPTGEKSLAGNEETYRALMLLCPPVPVHRTFVVFDYGQLAFDEEYEAVATMARDLFPNKDADYSIIRLNTNLIKELNNGEGLLFGNGETSKLKGRNLVMALEAIKYRGPIDQLVFCLTQETDIDMPPDTTGRFMDNLNNVLVKSGMVDLVIAPLIEEAKAFAVFQAYRYYPRLFFSAFSCWTPREPVATQGYRKPCGECRHCRRFEHFQRIAFQDEYNG